jgi:hypothetical protein
MSMIRASLPSAARAMNSSEADGLAWNQPTWFSALETWTRSQ